MCNYAEDEKCPCAVKCVVCAAQTKIVCTSCLQFFFSVNFLFSLMLFLAASIMLKNDCFDHKTLYS